MILYQPPTAGSKEEALEIADAVACRVKAEGGDAISQIRLAEKYLRGMGVPKDDKQAVNWFSKAAAQGNAVAQTRLANMYAHGIGVSQDDKQAVNWLSKAAAQGNEKARFTLVNFKPHKL